MGVERGEAMREGACQGWAERDRRGGGGGNAHHTAWPLVWFKAEVYRLRVQKQVTKRLFWGGDGVVVLQQHGA